MISRASPEFPGLLGECICALSRHFVGLYTELPPPGEAREGRSKLDPVYVEVTEHRDGPTPEARRKYSSCADQLHAILDRLGITQHWVNRGAQHAYGAAQMTKLEPFDPEGNPGGCPAAHWAHPHEVPPPGSLCLIWTGGNDAHALVVLGPGSDTEHLLTANYGAGGMAPATRPGCNLADSPLSKDERGYLHIGGSHRQLRSIITPAALVPYLGEIDLTGAKLPGEIIDAVGAAKWTDGP
ncbi:MAG TPA: hypothetical protein VER96_33880 [Polyangiaceae bacterium]|nr:hypothetical protein [Polyangiaceae bacterium]